MGRTEDAATIAHVLNRIAYGPTRNEWRHAEQIGAVPFIEEQLAPERLADEETERRLAALTTLDKDASTLIQEYPPPQLARRALREDEEPDPEMLRRLAQNSLTPLRELSAARMVRAVSSRRQLAEVLTDFWFNHFNVFSNKGQVRYLLVPYERDSIRPHVLGEFRDMLGAVARSPAMLVYLDNWRSGAEEGREVAGPGPRRRLDDAVEDALRRRAARMGRPTPGLERMAQRRRARQRDPRRPPGLNENYAREVMELHTLGVDGGYNQDDVREVARAFTGWTITFGAQGVGFVFRPDWHDAEEKTVMGRRLAAGRGIEDGEDVLDLLVEHPSTARFVATKLTRRFVADEPPTRLVEAVAETFRRGGGDLRQTMSTLLLSDEFLAPRHHGAKVKSPLEFLSSAARALEVQPQADQSLARALGALGAPLYGASPPTGYPDTAEEWTSANAILARMDIGGRLAEAVFGGGGGRGRGGGRGSRGGAGGAAGRGRGFRGAGGRGPTGSVEARSDAILEQLLPGRQTADLRGKVLRWAEEQDQEPTNAQIATLILGSPEFQRR